MDSGRIHLPPIQDMLCRPLSFTEDHNQLPISPVSSTCSSNSSNIAYQPANKSPSPTPYQASAYLDWEQRSADKQDMIVKPAKNGHNSGKYYGNQQPLHYHSRSYSDQFLPRRSSASLSSSAVDPPRHRRTSSDILNKTYEKLNSSLQVNNTNNNRYKCSQCLKTFSRPSSLRIHILSHTGEKPHVCPQVGCGRRFSVQSNMRRHLKVHYCNPQQQQGYLGRLQHLK
ncbi:hypothetical protein INT48_004733 [Thamnidium elegans]|uniref:C2H2-type domain-containing protein n=1 Tax=Thamnidium elegans TaxID=101142 RepID=A0A8H7VUR6_9FUNG|nr:hypothetical protein INT48_004733 [Thamnidium elegans]